jgi:GT2 family glycosyltransferase
MVDNGSYDVSVGYIYDAIDDGFIERENVLWLPINVGFTVAQNYAFKILRGRRKYAYYAFLNIDATADSNWLINLYNAAQQDILNKIGMWSSLILQPNNKEKVSSVGHWFSSENGKCYDIDWNLPKSSKNCHFTKSTFEPFGPCFAAALISTEMLYNVGLPDNEQFLYYDDIDLAFKARLNEWKCHFVSNAIAFHPLPGSRKSYHAAIPYQIEGQLMLVLRYFPEPERTKILSNLSPNQKEIIQRISTSRRLPFSTEKNRRKVFNYWADKNKPIKK